MIERRKSRVERTPEGLWQAMLNARPVGPPCVREADAWFNLQEAERKRRERL